MEERLDVMTDYQMRTIINMIISIVRDTEKKEDIEEKLIAIRDGQFAGAMEDKKT